MAKETRKLQQYHIKYLFNTKEGSNGEIEDKKKKKYEIQKKQQNKEYALPYQ